MCVECRSLPTSHGCRGDCADARQAEEEPGQVAVGDGAPCVMCGRRFASRNLVFRHLRDPSTGCGVHVAAQGGLRLAPSSAARQVAAAARRNPQVRSDRARGFRVERKGC